MTKKRVGDHIVSVLRSPWGGVDKRSQHALNLPIQYSCPVRTVIEAIESGKIPNGHISTTACSSCRATVDIYARVVKR